MTIKEFYEKISGDYADVKTRLPSDSMIAKFVKRFPNDPSMNQLNEAFASEDGDAIFRASHTLKGVCATLGLSNIFTSASFITEAYRPACESRPSEDEIATAYDRCKSEYSKTISAIAEID